MRIAVAELAQETDTFSPMAATLRDFEAYGIYEGEEILQKMQGVGPIGGFLQVAAQQQSTFTLLPILRAWAGAGGTITADTLNVLTDRLLTGLKDAMPLDGVLLSLHGAAASDEHDDVEGYVLESVRGVMGSELPVVVAVDHHANVTRKMVKHADALVGHETQPHDPRATGRKAAAVLFAMLRGEITPTMAFRKIPMITPQDHYLTAHGPMKEWFDLARAFEKREEVVDVSPYPMQPWLDVSEGGWAVVVHTNNNQDLAEQLANEMADRAWKMRERFWESGRFAPDVAVRHADDAPEGLVILSDTGDSVYGGAPGDNTCILRALLEQSTSGVSLVPMVDLGALDVAHGAGAGGQIDVAVGGKVDNQFCSPASITARVRSLSNGLTVDLDDYGICDLGRTALLEVGPIRIVLLGHRSFAVNHPVLYQHLGIDIADAKMVVVKTASNFQYFAPWRKELIRVDSPGMTQSNLHRFEWQRVTRPIYPLDDLAEWRAGS